VDALDVVEEPKTDSASDAEDADLEEESPIYV
jgi:hypothetical protein